MGNISSAFSKKTHSGKRPTKVTPKEPHDPHYGVSLMERKLKTKPEVVVSLGEYTTQQQQQQQQQQGEKEKPLCDDQTFSNYIQCTKYKINRSKSNIGCDEEQSYPIDVANCTFNNKENEIDPFSDYIQNARKKMRMRTLSINNRRG